MEKEGKRWRMEIMQKKFVESESEFNLCMLNEFKPRLKSPKKPGSIERRLKRNQPYLSRGSNSLNSGSEQSFCNQLKFSNPYISLQFLMV